MAFTVPTFNLTARLWRNYPTNGVLPPQIAATLTFACQLRLYKTAFLVGTAGSASGNVALLCPTHTDIRPVVSGALAADLVECPLGSGRFYRVSNVDDVAKGFGNEYRLASMQNQKQLPGGWAVPTP